MQNQSGMARRDGLRKSPRTPKSATSPDDSGRDRMVTPHCAFTVDKMLRIRAMDDNLLGILDKEPSQVLGIPYYELLPRIEVGGTDAVEDVIRHVGARVVKGFKLFTIARRVIAADIFIYVSENPKGEISGALVIAKALPHSGIAGELQRAQQSIDIGMIAATIAHGVRNPLNAIKGAVFYLKRRYAKEKTVVELVDVAEEEIERLEDFITRFLSTSTSGPVFVESDVYSALKKAGTSDRLKTTGKAPDRRPTNVRKGGLVCLNFPHACNGEDCGQPQEAINLGKVVVTLASGVKNPLNAIKGAFFYLGRKYAGDSTIADFSKMVEEEIARLDDFITSFLNTSAWTQNLFEADLNEIIKKLEAFVKLQAGASDIHCLYMYGDVPHVLINTMEIQQAILNILTNSIEAMPNGGDISVKTMRETINGKDFAVIEVSDAGKGISKAQVDRLLSIPHYREGRGFGLYITRYLMRRHGGDLQITSQRGMGTTVRLLLPAIARGGRIARGAHGRRRLERE